MMIMMMFTMGGVDHEGDSEPRIQWPNRWPAMKLAKLYGWASRARLASWKPLGAHRSGDCRIWVDFFRNTLREHQDHYDDAEPPPPTPRPDAGDWRAKLLTREHDCLRSCR